MQLINVLRDVSEDYERGRVYLPKEVLAAHNIARICQTKSSSKPFMELFHARVPRSRAQAPDFGGSSIRLSRFSLKSQPRIMLDAYSKIFDEIVRRSGDVFSTPLKLSKASKMSLWMKINYMKLRARLSVE